MLSTIVCLEATCRIGTAQERKWQSSVFALTHCRSVRRSGALRSWQGVGHATFWSTPLSTNVETAIPSC